MQKLLDRLIIDFPDIFFKEGENFHWSPKTNSVIYSKESKKNSNWTLLHEVAHAKLNHRTYESDIELLRMEVLAWQHASKLAKKYDIKIDDDYIQNCLDSYRDWLHQRSTCPKCDNHSLQQDSTHYFCFNCHTTWKVTIARFCRPYRKIEHKKETSPSVSPQVMFL